MDKKRYIEEEAFVIQHSGEIPEVTLHESLYHLTQDPDGPVLTLETEDVLPLKNAVVKRYRAIILRDLDPGNRDKSIYRGLARCLANWQRMHKFCTREGIEFRAIQHETATALMRFIDNELAEVQGGSRTSCINCCQAEIDELARSLGLRLDDFPDGWQELC
ncbi:hypothetical protein ACFLYW_00470 [Thermodesulfobacteriota bacterium]